MALSTNLKKSYFINEHKYILPAVYFTESNRDLAATVAANFASLGYRMENTDIETLSYARKEDIIAFWQEYYPILEEAIGANHEYKPLYPNFPQEVMEKENIDFFMDQVIYGLSGFEIRPEVYEEAVKRLPYLGQSAERRVSQGTEEDYVWSVENAAKSPVAYTPMQRNYISDFIKEYDNALNMLPKADKIPNHENRIVLACSLMDADKKGRAKEYLIDANDIIKYAAVRSAQNDYKKGKGKIEEIENGKRYGGKYKKEDFYRYASLRFPKDKSPSFKLPRPERNMVMKAIEANARLYGVKGLEQCMMQNKKHWKALIKSVHIGDYPKAKLARQAFEDISTNKPVERNSRTIEEAIKQNKLSVALDAAVKQPGDFVRRTDKFLQMGMQKGNVAPVITALRDIASKASVATLTALAAHINGRMQKQEQRTFNIAASNARWTTEDKRIPITPLIAQLVHDACISGIREQMTGKNIFAPESSVYISPKMNDYNIPSDVRSASEGMHSYTMGSKIDTSSKADFRRLFVWWTNTEKAMVDIDMSVALYDADGKLVRNCGWNTEYKIPVNDNYAFLFSGDVRNGGAVNGKGAAEFMDINMDALREMGVKYIVPSINSYSRVPFYTMPNISFGYMDRDTITKDGMDGKLFEAKTVETKFDLNANATSCIPCVFVVGDKALETDHSIGNVDMIWIDTPYNGRVQTCDGSMISQLLDYAMNKNVLSIADLAKINLEANMEANDLTLAADPVKADYLFITEKELEELKETFADEGIDFEKKTIIFPTDLNYVMGTLMAAADKDTKDDINLDEVLKSVDAEKENDMDKDRGEGTR